jgi:hypothetical protein
LYPGDDGHSLADDSVGFDHDLPHLPVYTFLKVELQVDTHGNLRDQHQHNVGNKLGVDVLGELSALMLVTKEVSNDGEEGAESLYWNVPLRADYLKSSAMALFGIILIYSRPAPFQ